MDEQDDRPIRKYFVHLELAVATPDRCQEAIKAITAVLRGISSGDMAQAHYSLGRDQMGFFVATRLVAPQILRAIEAPRSGHASVTRRGDKLLIVDVGADAVSVGKDVAAAWLQHH